MKIRNVIHRGLRRFIEKDDPSGLPAAFREKVRNIVTFLQEMDDVDELQASRAGRPTSSPATGRGRGA
jgi:proteic killer suppression protein